MSLLKSFILLLFTGKLCFLSLPVMSQPIADHFFFTSPKELRGLIGERLDASYENRILAQDVDRLIRAFEPENRTETRMWQSEFWGKWFTSAVLAYQYRPEERLKKVLDHAVEGLLATQTPDGYIGNYDAAHRLEQWDVWGRKYCMLGLLAYYELTADKKCLQAAAHVADNLLDDLDKADGILVTKGNYRGMAASSVLEPICLLYRQTKEKKYLDFAERIVAQWETPDGPQLISKSSTPVADRFPKPANWYSWEQGQKAYEMMSCYEGLLELYRITGRERYKKAVEETWQHIYEEEINIVGSGASTEMWFGGKSLQAVPVHHYQETCVTVTWIKLSAQLLRLTGESKYADAIEQAYYNALLGSMSKDGVQWAKYTPLMGQRLPGSEQCGMGLNCCEASGPRALFLFPRLALTEGKEGIQVNYYTAGRFVAHSPMKRPIEILQSTTYPKEGWITMQVHLQKDEAFAIDLRIPSWSEVSILKVNGEKVAVPSAGDYVSLRRQWKDGDQIELQLDMRGRIIKMGTGRQVYAAVLRGPLVLARDARLGGIPVGAAITPMATDAGYIDLTPVNDPKGVFQLVYNASFQPESYAEKAAGPIDVLLCDYAAAGYESGAHPFFQTWIPQIVDPK